MTRTAEAGLVFDNEKCFIKQTSISFFGNINTPTGIKPDPTKVFDIKKMPTPQNKDELELILGILNYFFQYVPKLAEKARPHGNFKSQSPWA